MWIYKFQILCFYCEGGLSIVPVSVRLVDVNLPRRVSGYEARLTASSDLSDRSHQLDGLSGSQTLQASSGDTVSGLITDVKYQ